jgi:hypothetical protein
MVFSSSDETNSRGSSWQTFGFTKSSDLNSSHKSRDDYDLSTFEKDNDMKLGAIDAAIITPVLFLILFGELMN